MATDVREHRISATDGVAAALCSLAVENFVQRKSDVVPHLLNAMEADPGCGFANTVFGLLMHGARNANLRPQIIEAADKSKALLSSMTEREQLYAQALSHFADRRLYDGIACFEQILDKHPTDALALALCQGELFWLGDMSRSLRVSDSVDAAWSDSIPGYADYLAIRAFDLEEAGQYGAAEAAGKQAVAMRSSNIWGAHAVAHVLYMQARHQDGIDWLQPLQNEWGSCNQLVFHIWWHQCLFHLERGEHEAILQHYDHWVRNREHPLMQLVPDLYIDLQNGSSMLWRLEHAGVDVGDRWEEMADLVLTRIDDLSNPFTSAHFAVVLAAVGNYSACDQLVITMQSVAMSDELPLSGRYHGSAVPAAIAAIAHRRGAYDKVVETLMPVRHAIADMGGSHAQQDLFYQILVDAALKVGDTTLSKQLIHEIEQIGFTEPARRAGYQAVAAVC